MSTQYDMYIGHKGADGKYSVIAPFVKTEDGFKLRSFWWSSGSWIYEVKKEFWDLGVEKIAEDSYSYLTYTNNFNNNERCSCTMFLPLTDIPRCDAYKEGYLNYDSYRSYLRGADVDDVYYDIIGAKEVGAMTEQAREKYMKDACFVAIENHSSKEYVFSLAHKIIDAMLPSWEYKEEDLCLLMTWG